MDEKVEEKTRRIKTKRKYSLPEARLKFERELEILKALVEFSKKGEKPIKYSNFIGLGSTTYVSSELAFFADAGLAIKEKGSKYLPTDEVIEFVNILNWDEEEAKKKLANILSNSWFGDVTIKILKIRNKIGLNDLMKELGKTAEADPNKDVKALKRLVEWLEYAGIIEIDENENVRLKKVISPQNVEEKLPSSEKIESISETTTEEKIVKSEEIKKVRKGILLNLTINLQIDSNTDVEKIREIIRAIKQDLVEDDNDE